MKNIKLNSKKLFVILLSGFIIITSSGCNNKKELIDYNSNNGYTVENNVERETNNKLTTTHNTSSKTDRKETTSKKDKTTNTANNTETKTTTNSSENDETKTTVEYTDNSETTTIKEEFTADDKEVVAYFNELKTNVQETLNSETSEEVKDKVKGTFITVVDFIFYEGEIKGIKFDDLTEGAKQNILETATTVDNMIMSKFPNYKEEISSTVTNAYNKASELIKKGANNVSEFSKEKLGEENYNAIIEAKDELVYYTKNAIEVVGEFAGTVWDKGKEKVKNWYENFKNN